jgi:ABC-type transport system involved in multi-copper enzyme maturation permease subunit
MLTRPIRRIEFVLAKILALVFATVVVVMAGALASYLVGGTVQERTPRVTWTADRVPTTSWKFPSYSDLVDPQYPDQVTASRGKIVGNILFGFALLVVPVLAAVSVGFLLGTLMDSTGLAIGLSVGAFVTLEATKFIPMFEEHLGRLAFNYPITRIGTLMMEAGRGTVPQWGDALVGVGISAIYVAVCLIISVVVFCRRDITL